MMRAFTFTVGLCLVLTSCTTASPQQEIGNLGLIQAQCDRFTFYISLNTNWEASPNPNTSTYRVFRMVGPQGVTLMAQSNNDTIELQGLQEWTPYHIYASARSRRTDGWGIPIYRKVGELTVVTPHCSTPSPWSPVPGDVRLRHEATGKCLFGNALDGGEVKTWQCWQDPQMAISLEPLGGNEVRLRVRSYGKCLYGNPVNGGMVKNWNCWNDPNMVYVREELGNNRVRLRHKATGQCMYGSPTDGGPVRNWPCWNDPNMIWVIDPF